MAKHVISIGFEIDNDDIEEASFRSNKSLLDADIVVFSPDLSDFNFESLQRGKRAFDESDSFEISELASHWRREIRATQEAGKTVFFFTREIDSFLLKTTSTHLGQRIWDNFEPYSIAGIDLGIITRSSGWRIQPARDLGPLSGYWKQFDDYSTYEVYFENPSGVTYLETQSGAKAVGLIQSSPNGGHIVVLPIPNLFQMTMDRIRDSDLAGYGTMSEVEIAVAAADKNAPAEVALIRKSVGRQFVSALIEVDKLLHGHGGMTSPPWMKSEEFHFQEERELRAELSATTAQLEALEERKLLLQTRLEQAGRLRDLLSGTGSSLEAVILEALRYLGFTAQSFKEGESQFDAVFVAPEGVRLIGEAEGKDERAIGIEKLDQLERNIREEYSLRDDGEFAKGVLFGNAFRLTEPAKRGDFFTQKCRMSAARTKVALVRTPDLFTVAKYLKETNDPQFAELCRKAIVETNGTIVVFPLIPKAKVDPR